MTTAEALWRDLEAALAAIDDPRIAGRIAWMVEAARLKTGRAESSPVLATLQGQERVALLAQVAQGGHPPSSAVADAVRAALAAHPGEPTEVLAGLGLWAGLTPAEAGFDGLLEPYKAMALGRCLSGGVPETAAAPALIEALLRDPFARDDAIMALLQARLAPSDAPGAWLDRLDRVTFPATRAQLLLELACQIPDAGAAEARLVAAARAAYEAADPAEAFLPGAREATAAGVLCRADAATAAALADEAWRTLAAMKDLQDRARLTQRLLMAESQRGLEAWRAALQHLGEDGMRHTAPDRWAGLIYDAAGLARFLRGDAVARSAALSPVGELARRVTDPMLRALTFAAFAEASAATADRAPATALAEVERALRASDGRPGRLLHFPRVARLCGQADLAGAAALAVELPTPRERVFWLLALVEVAAGIRR